MERISEYQDERWKERARQIRELDGNKCALCGATGLLHVHHLSYPPAPFHLWDSRDDELVTLCPDCHRKVHESPKRPYLDEYRVVCNFEEKSEDEQFAEELAEERREYEKKLDEAISCGRLCCALCNHHANWYYHSICWKRHEEGRADYHVEPTDTCEEFYMSD